MVQRLPDPGLVPTSQEGGGGVHTNALARTAKGTPPGFDGGLMIAPTTTDVPLPAPPPMPVSDEKDRTKTEPGVAGNSGLWKRTPSAS